MTYFALGDRRIHMLGQFVWYGYDLPLATRVRQIKSAGFDSTMVWWGDDLALKDGPKDRVVDIVRSSGLKLENIHVSFEHCNCFWSDVEEDRRKIKDLHYEWLEDCANFRIPMMVMHVTKGTNVPSPNLGGIKCLEDLVERAESYGIQIAIENTRINNVVVSVLDEITSKTLGFCYDSSHDKLYSLQEFDILEKCGKRLIATHFSDNDGLTDGHLLPQTGLINWNRLFDLFPNAYRGCISLEVVKGNEAISSDGFLEKAFQKAQWIESNIFSDR